MSEIFIINLVTTLLYKSMCDLDFEVRRLETWLISNPLLFKLSNSKQVKIRKTAWPV